jgi:hypothetical protein
VEVEFVWITPECRDSQEYPATSRPKCPKHRERYIPLKEVDKGIWEKYEDALKKLPQDKAAQKSGLKTKLLKTKLLQKELLQKELLQKELLQKELLQKE